MKLGVHVSIGKGFEDAVRRAQAATCESFQIFAGNPRGWARKPIPAAEIETFRKARQETGLGPVTVHLSYLPNMASPDPELYEKSVLAMAEDYQRAVLLGAEFFVMHPGKHGKDESPAAGLERVAAAVKTVLNQLDGSTRLLFENQAGAGHEIAGQIEELGNLLKMVGIPERTGVCFDTCHAHAAGYDLTTEAGWDKLNQEIDDHLGFANIALLHLNDAKGDVGGHLDRHEHWGEGRIGAVGFRALAKQTRWRSLPGVLETPEDQPGDDIRNLTFLRRILQEENP